MWTVSRCARASCPILASSSIPVTCAAWRSRIARPSVPTLQPTSRTRVTPRGTDTQRVLEAERDEGLGSSALDVVDLVLATQTEASGDLGQEAGSEEGIGPGLVHVQTDGGVRVLVAGGDLDQDL